MATDNKQGEGSDYSGRSWDDFWIQDNRVPRSPPCCRFQKGTLSFLYLLFFSFIIIPYLSLRGLVISQQRWKSLRKEVWRVQGVLDVLSFFASCKIEFSNSFSLKLLLIVWIEWMINYKSCFQYFFNKLIMTNKTKRCVSMIIWNIHISNSVSDSFDAFSWQNGIFFIVHLFMFSLRDQGLCCLTYSNASSPSSRSPVTVKILSNQSANMSKNKVFLNGSKLGDSFKTRAAEVGSLSARAKMPTKIFVRHILHILQHILISRHNSVC